MSLGKILVVDDEPEVREVFLEFLTDRGYDIVPAGSGLEALVAFQTHKPDLVLLDVEMPGMDGVETLRRILALDPFVQVIMVTGNADPSITSALLAIGAVDYILKPFDLDGLDQAVSIQLSAAQDRSPATFDLSRPASRSC
jgi:two-component system OmpR family response regulator